MKRLSEGYYAFVGPQLRSDRELTNSYTQVVATRKLIDVWSRGKVTKNLLLSSLTGLS